jgi:methyltransferase (TIGR00027 family)
MWRNIWPDPPAIAPAVVLGSEAFQVVIPDQPLHSETMRTGQPSRTALRAAAHRAAHQTCEDGAVFRDPLATSILGAAPERVLASPLDAPEVRSMRLFIAARSRFAEERLAVAVARGVRQYVVLGAGLDTFALRNPFAGLKVFEVDHPASQAWKRERMREAALAPSETLTFAPVDFERETLAGGLAAAGFQAEAPAVFAWLGVVVYLTRTAVFDTLAFIAGGANEVVFDYGEPNAAFPKDRRPRLAAREARLAEMGEPWLTRFEPPELATKLSELGFEEVEDLGPGDIAARFLGLPGRKGPGGHLVSARVI